MYSHQMTTPISAIVLLLLQFIPLSTPRTVFLGHSRAFFIPDDVPHTPQTQHRPTTQLSSSGTQEEDDRTTERPSNSGGRHECLMEVLAGCDLKNLSDALHLTATPCMLLKELEICLNEKVGDCSHPDLGLLKASLGYLIEGFHANDKCLDVLVAPRDVALIAGHAGTCQPQHSYRCLTNLVTQLRAQPPSAACDSLVEFRRCIHQSTHTCGYLDSRFLVDGSRGLAWTYRRAESCKQNHFLANIRDRKRTPRHRQHYSTG